ncbi:lipoprotein LpqH [Mycolicibacterium sp. XJ1819]
MDNRLLASAAMVFVACAAACSSPAPALGGTTAKVTLNGESTGGPHPVSCRQSGWAWNIDSLDEDNGFRVALDTGDEVTVQSVEFRDFNGFTGTFWNGRIGEAEVDGVGGNYTITGSADGAFTDNPSDAVTATFRIEASC